jgi:hypothetical protein
MKTSAHFLALFPPLYYDICNFKGAPVLNLTARARQFGTFILMVGKLAAADVFDPVASIVIANKDDLTIPLTLETVPTPKEFRDAIESLSPEQQAFCKAYRGMQLASSVFAMAVIQVQPQVRLPPLCSHHPSLRSPCN